MIISQFDTDPTLIALGHSHHNWHGPAGSAGTRTLRPGQAGAGTEFLNFHKSVMDQFLAWNNANGQPISPTLLAAFTGVPSFLKTNAFGWNSTVPGWQTSWGLGAVPTRAQAENRILNDKASFSSLDQYAQYIEVTIHNWIHGAIASWLNTDGDPNNNDPFIASFHSPQSTYFYQIHGLIDLWGTNFSAKAFAADLPELRKVVVDHKPQLKERVKEWKEVTKERIKEDPKEFVKDGRKDVIKDGIKDGFKDTVKDGIKDDFKEGGKDIKEKDKDLVEDPRIPDDPRILERDHLIRDLTDRLSKLEARANPGKAFIKPGERPDVGRKKKDI